jgi:hypothetical protein
MYYHVNNRSQPNGDYEVHTGECRYLPTDRRPLGYHGSCESAVASAKQIYPTANGCAFCAPRCHTS